VDLAPFLISKLEVTNDQFGAFARATSHVTEAERVRDPLDAGAAEFGLQVTLTWRTPARDGRPAPGQHPVVRVSWHDARAYAKWAGLELPTEAQWEKAAAWDPVAGKARRYSWGDDPPRERPVANLADETSLDVDEARDKEGI